MATYSIDRIEGDYAVLVGENGPDLSVLLTELPDGIREGNVLRYENGIYILDKTEEQARRAEILSLQNKFRRKK